MDMPDDRSTKNPEESGAGEADLVARARTGDEQALSCLIEKNEPRLRQRIHQRLSPAVRRKFSESDVLQETLVIAAQSIDEFEYRGPGSFGAWLTGIAENATRRAVTHYAGTKKRDVRNEVTQNARAKTGAHPGVGPSPSQVAMAAETKERIARALSELSEDHQAVVRLLQHRRVTIAEAAELMGRSVNAVKKLHARALIQLADRLGLEGRKSK